MQFGKVIGFSIAIVLIASLACSSDEPAPAPVPADPTPIPAAPKATPTVAVVSVSKATSTPVPAAAPSGPVGNVVVAYHSFSREVLDHSNDSTSALPYHQQMYDWLIGATPDGMPSSDNGVLASWETTDAKSYTFTLKEGLTWQDGSEITSEDLKFTLEHFAREGSVCITCSLLRKGLDSVDIDDRYTVTMHLTEPNVLVIPAFGPLEGDVLIMPKAYYEPIGANKFELAPMGSGPWKFVQRRIGEFINYEANTDYWDSSRVPGFASLSMVLVPEAKTRVAMLKTGEADLISLDPGDVQPLIKAGFNIIGPENVGSSVIEFPRSWDPDFLTNKLEFRKALALSVDWQAITEAFYPSGVGERHRGGAALFSPVTLGYDPSLAPYEYDLEEAKRSLSNVGYNGEKLQFWSWVAAANPEQQEVNEVIAGYWTAAGINVELIPIDSGTMSKKFRAADFEGPATASTVFPFARPSLLNNFRVQMISREAGGIVHAYWDLDSIDAVYNELKATTDEQERNTRLVSLNRKLHEEYWALPINIRHLPFGASARIADWQPITGAPAALAFETLKPK
jgi:peptide/nickel transport system substrate-binding protein